MLKATHLQSLFDHIQRVCEAFADDSSTAATNKVFNIGWEAEREKDSREEKKKIIREFWLKNIRGKLKMTFPKKVKKFLWSCITSSAIVSAKESQAICSGLQCLLESEDQLLLVHYTDLLFCPAQKNPILSQLAASGWKFSCPPHPVKTLVIGSLAPLAQAGVFWIGMSQADTAWFQRLVGNDFCIRLFPDKHELPAQNHHQPLPPKIKYSDMILKSLVSLLKNFQRNKVMLLLHPSLSRRHMYLELPRWQVASGWGSLTMELKTNIKTLNHEPGRFKLE